MTVRQSWDRYFIDEAARVATRSKDPERQVGAVIVLADGKEEASRGYNGLPSGIEDTPERMNDKEWKNAVILHAEENALRFALGKDLRGATIYVSPYMPCAHCSSWIISSGIKRIVTDMADTPEMSAKWRRSFEISKEIFAEAGVELDFIGGADRVDEES